MRLRTVKVRTRRAYSTSEQAGVGLQVGGEVTLNDGRLVEKHQCVRSVWVVRGILYDRNLTRSAQPLHIEQASSRNTSYPQVTMYAFGSCYKLALVRGTTQDLKFQVHTIKLTNNASIFTAITVFNYTVLMSLLR